MVQSIKYKYLLGYTTERHRNKRGLTVGRITVGIFTYAFNVSAKCKIHPYD